MPNTVWIWDTQKLALFCVIQQLSPVRYVSSSPLFLSPSTPPSLLSLFFSHLIVSLTPNRNPISSYSSIGCSNGSLMEINSQSVLEWASCTCGLPLVHRLLMFLPVASPSKVCGGMRMAALFFFLTRPDTVAVISSMKKMSRSELEAPLLFLISFISVILFPFHLSFSFSLFAFLFLHSIPALSVLILQLISPFLQLSCLVDRN